MQWSDDVEQADWIAVGLDEFSSGHVASVVPRGFARYARLLHPPTGRHDSGTRPLRWIHVADWSGTHLTPAAQFHDIAVPEHHPSAPAPWTGPPSSGVLTAHDAEALVDLLRGHTDTPEQCWFAVWDGRPWADDPVPAWMRSSDGPRVRLPGRHHMLYTGHIDDALALLEPVEHTPQLWWPADRAWCVASDIDLTSTYLAGTQQLVDTVLASPTLEALAASADDTIHMRLVGWQADAVDHAVDTLLAEGRASITTSLGALHARLAPPDATDRRFGLHHRRTSIDGHQTSTGWVAVGPDPAFMRRELGIYLTAEIAALLR